MSATHKSYLRKFKREAGLLNQSLGSGAFMRMPSNAQHGRVSAVRGLYRRLAGVVPEATLRKILAGACALVIGFSAACSDDDTSSTADAKVSQPDAGVDQMVADKGADGVIPDALTVDMALADATQTDATQTDATQTDATQTDATTTDMAMVDAATVDMAVTSDAGMVDASTVTPDASAVTPDAGTVTPDQGATPDAATIPSDQAIASDATTGGNAFKAGVSNPWSFAKPSTAYYDGYYPTLADLDGDGDLDLITGAYGYSGYDPSLYYYKNSGTSTAPKLDAPVSNVYSVAPNTDYETGVALADIDGDGDLDMFVFAGYYASNLFYKNTGTKTAPTFAAKTTGAFGLPSANNAYGVVAPQFVDIDDDGDLDLFIVEQSDTASNSTLSFHENTGTKTAPAFAAAASKKFGLPAGMSPSFAFADMDGDGDLDLLGIPAGNNKFFYWQNTGSKTSPAFGAAMATNFGLALPAGVTGSTVMVMADIDGDGDLDLVLGYDDGIVFFENTKK